MISFVHLIQPVTFILSRHLNGKQSVVLNKNKASFGKKLLMDGGYDTDVLSDLKKKAYLNDGADMNRCFHFVSMLPGGPLIIESIYQSGSTYHYTPNVHEAGAH